MDLFPKIVGQIAPRGPEIVARLLQEVGVGRDALNVEVDYSRIDVLCRQAGVPARVIPLQRDMFMRPTRFWGEQRARPLSIEQGIPAIAAKSDSD